MDRLVITALIFSISSEFAFADYYELPMSYTFSQLDNNINSTIRHVTNDIKVNVSETNMGSVKRFVDVLDKLNPNSKTVIDFIGDFVKGVGDHLTMDFTLNDDITNDFSDIFTEYVHTYSGPTMNSATYELLHAVCVDGESDYQYTVTQILGAIGSIDKEAVLSAFYLLNISITYQQRRGKADGYPPIIFCALISLYKYNFDKLDYVTSLLDKQRIHDAAQDYRMLLFCTFYRYAKHFNANFETFFYEIFNYNGYASSYAQPSGGYNTQYNTHQGYAPHQSRVPVQSSYHQGPVAHGPPQTGYYQDQGHQAHQVGYREVPVAHGSQPPGYYANQGHQVQQPVGYQGGNYGQQQMGGFQAPSFPNAGFPPPASNNAESFGDGAQNGAAAVEFGATNFANAHGTGSSNFGKAAGDFGRNYANTEGTGSNNNSFATGVGANNNARSSGNAANNLAMAGSGVATMPSQQAFFGGQGGGQGYAPPAQGYGGHAQGYGGRGQSYGNHY